MTPALTREDFARLRGMLEKHADPWEAVGHYVRTEYRGHGGFVVANCADAIAGASDAAMFIAAMRMALPTLLAIAEANLPLPEPPK